jgi:hypothetical protein
MGNLEACPTLFLAGMATKFLLEREGGCRHDTITATVSKQDL